MREIDIIEVLDILACKSWEYFRVEGLYWRQRASMVAIDKENILIMGGWHDAQTLSVV